MLGNLSNTTHDQATQTVTPAQPARSKPAQIAAVRTEHDELRSAMRVLGAVVGELAERIEVLETRESVRDAADAVAAKR
jgi:hypothetical protein